MSELLPDRPEEPTPPGYETWSPTMGRGAKAVAWVLLIVVAVGLVVMGITILS